MKILNKNFRILSLLVVMLFIVMATSCKEEETYGPFDATSLEQAITAAETKLASSEEGTLPGQYKPGSLAVVEDVIVWAKWMTTNAKSQNQIDDAVNKVTLYLNKLEENIVTVAIPWIHQENGTMIKISDNTAGSGVAGGLDAITKKPFTIEAKFYILDLNQKGYSNTFFANVMGEGGPDDRGFDIRYFGDGVVHLNVGGDGWNDVKSAPGTIKAGQWITISYVNNLTSHKLYLDGVEILSNDNLYVDSDSDYPVTIGNTKPWDDRVVNAMVKDVRLWSEVRTGAQINETLNEVTGDEANLELYIPFNADLGTEIPSTNGKFKGTFLGNIEWVAGGIPPVIVLDYATINAAKSAVQAAMPVSEGTNDGDYPIGTNNYLQSLIDKADDLIANANRQDQLDDGAESINGKLATVLAMTVADADGIFIDRDDPNAVGLRITPNYTPQGNYTVEFEVKVKSLEGYGTGEFFNNGEFGIWVYGFTELTEEAFLNSGGLRNFTSGPSGWEMGPTAPSLTITPGNWQHIAIVHNEDVGGFPITYLYVDGVETGRDTIGVPNVSGWGEIWLGNGWGKMNGSLKNFRMWDEARTVGNLNANITGTEPNLQIYLPLNKVAGVGFNDVTGNYNAEMRGIKWNTN